MEDAKQFKGAEYWINYMKSEKKIKKLEQRMDEKHSGRSASSFSEKRERSGSSSTTSNKRHRMEDDKIRRSTQLPTPGPTPKKEGSEFDDVVISIESDDEDKDGKLGSNKKKRKDSKIDDPFSIRTTSSEEEDPVEKEERLIIKEREKNKRAVRRDPPRYDERAA